MPGFERQEDGEPVPVPWLTDHDGTEGLGVPGFDTFINPMGKRINLAEFLKPRLSSSRLAFMLGEILCPVRCRKRIGRWGVLR